MTTHFSLTGSQLAWITGDYIRMCSRLGFTPVDVTYWAATTYSRPQQPCHDASSSSTPLADHSMGEERLLMAEQPSLEAYERACAAYVEACADRDRYRGATRAAMGYLTDQTMDRGDRIRLAQLALEKAGGGS